MSTPTTRPPTGLLIIGASQAGVQLAISLRGTGFDEHITLLDLAGIALIRAGVALTRNQATREPAKEPSTKEPR